MCGRFVCSVGKIFSVASHRKNPIPGAMSSSSISADEDNVRPSPPIDVTALPKWLDYVKSVAPPMPDVQVGDEN
jgi:hypothetical protein